MRWTREKQRHFWRFSKFLEKIFLFTRTVITGFLKIMAYKTIVKAISVNSDALRELVPLVQFKKQKNTHGGV